MLVYPTCHIFRIKSENESPLSLANPPTPPPILLEGGPVYSVLHILCSRRWGGGLQYLIDWKGYGLEESSWIPARYIVAPQLTLDFHQ